MAMSTDFFSGVEELGGWAVGSVGWSSLDAGGDIDVLVVEKSPKHSSGHVLKRYWNCEERK